MELDGQDLRPLPLVSRKAHLQKLMAKNKSADLAVVPSFEDGERLMVACMEHGLEGVLGAEAPKPGACRRARRDVSALRPTAAWRGVPVRRASRDAIRGLFRVSDNRAPAFDRLPAIFPNYTAPVMWQPPGERELVLMNWAFHCRSLATHHTGHDNLLGGQYTLRYDCACNPKRPKHLRSRLPFLPDGSWKSRSR